MSGNKTLGKAKMQKNDEFYTQLSDIENELRHYKKHFKNKIVLCNCDDPYESNFFKYFALNFNALGLKKLITTCYASSHVTGKEFQYYVNNDGQFSFVLSTNDTSVQKESERKPYKVEITEVTDKNGDGRIDLADVEYLMRSKKNTMTLLDGNGDFRSSECVELMKEADIVVTNPPFSLLRDYITQLIEYQKDFLIIGNQNTLHSVEIFPLVRENKLWIGFNHVKQFIQPDGSKKIFGNICWFTNLDIDKRHEKLILYKPYIRENYPTYINFDAIEVSKISDIPYDFYGMMGVSDTFLHSYNPEQFEIIGLAEGELGKQIGLSANLTEQECKELFNESKSFRRGNPIYRDKNGKLKKPFARIIIRRKQVNTNEN